MNVTFLRFSSVCSSIVPLPEFFSSILTRDHNVNQTNWSVYRAKSSAPRATNASPRGNYRIRPEIAKFSDSNDLQARSRLLHAVPFSGCTTHRIDLSFYNENFIFRLHHFTLRFNEGPVDILFIEISNLQRAVSDLLSVSYGRISEIIPSRHWKILFAEISRKGRRSFSGHVYFTLQCDI